MRAGAASPTGFIARSWARHRPTRKEAPVELLAATFTVTGTQGWLTLAAVILFGVAAVLAWFTPPHKAVTVLLCAGLCLWALGQLWH